ncbi:MAG TPA: hypothetical protein VMV69_24555 [Pirellulales bacterium]|nr:hypothetical protein [Pirellulales bacterium]
MTSLAPLHARLTALARRRRGARLATACGAVALAAIVSLWAWFVIDWWLEWGRGPRLLGLLLVALAVLLAIRRFVARAMATRETETDVALWVQRRQRLDGDLVAALQFEPASAAAWGSRQLELAIVEYVAHFGETLRVAPERPSRRVVAGGLLLILAACAGAAGIATHPLHAAAFRDRLLLGTTRYPTRTRIVSVAINRHVISGNPNATQCAAGDDARFMVRCDGELPSSGRVVFTALPGGDTATIELVRGEGRPACGTEFIPSSSTGDGARSVPATMGLYVARLPKPADSLEYQIHIGDASTEPASLVVVPAPVLFLSLRSSPPDYAANDESRTEVEPGSTRISVLEGSRVELDVVCKNKELKQVTLQLGPRTFELRPADDARRHWRLNVAGTPLERVTDMLPFSIRATDADGLELSEPLSGMIGLSVDQPPRVIAGAVTQVLLPTARPTIHYTARDDYGVAALWMRREILRPGETAREDQIEIAVGQSPAKAIQGTLILELGELRLVKGDQLRITFEATDLRGPGEGKRATSDPLVFRVTDARGVLTAMTETDERSTGDLDSTGELDWIIERQLGTEDEP